MLNGATVTLAGYVVRDPHYTKVNETIPKVSVRVAWTARYMDRVTGEWRDGKTSFANVNCWRKVAHNVAMSLRKGQPVLVTGRLQVREYDDKEGRHRISVDIEADSIGHDFTRGVGVFQRLPRESQEGGDQAQRGDLATVPETAEGLQDLAPAGDTPTADLMAADPMPEAVTAESEKAAVAVPF
jgi:single-strand DNA-binding protein